jgi:hypothetical protein
MKRALTGLLVTGLCLAACKKEYNTNYNSTDYQTYGNKPCTQVLTGTLAGITLTPGVYCFDAGSTLTGLLTLNGPANGTWDFKVGTGVAAGLTGTNFNMVMAGGANACGVTWRVTDGITFTDSNILGTFLAGKDITLTRGTLTGRVWSQTNVVTITQTVIVNCDGSTP